MLVCGCRNDGKIEAECSPKECPQTRPSQLVFLSGKAYEMIGDSGCISLPSHYTHFVQSTSGFSAEVDSQLIRASQVSTAEDWAKCVYLVMVCERRSRVQQAFW